MDKEPEVQTTKLRSVIERITTFIPGDDLTLVRKKRPLKDRMDRPFPMVNERFDTWGDDTEEDMIDEKRVKKGNTI